MLEKLAQINRRYDEIEALLSDPSAYADPAYMAKLLKEQKEIAPVVEGYRTYTRCETRAAEAKEMLTGETDPDLRALAQEEYDEAL
ncbi:MAG: PCRF domain-containing protein, partial [Oscillospiraceae bacterium]|nr:PCRF domain-containing protein [Oscillospiraceae bacterium]